MKNEQVQTTCMVILTVIALGGALYILRPVLVPFLLAMLFTYCLTPIINLQVRYFGIGRSFALLQTGLLGLVLLAFAGVLLTMAFFSISQNVESYQSQWNALVERVTKLLPLERVGMIPDPETGKLVLISDAVSQRIFTSVLTTVSELLSSGSLVFVFMMFLLFGQKEGGLPRTPTLVQIQSRVQRFLLELIFLSWVTGVLVGLSLGILGVPFAWLFGLLAFALNFIPTVGALVASLLPLPVILLSELSVPGKIMALGIPALIQTLIGTLVQPRLQGASMRLHPVMLVMGLVFFGMIWGVVGAFLATPTLAIIKIITERIQATQAFSALLAGDMNTFFHAMDNSEEPTDGVT